MCAHGDTDADKAGDWFRVSEETGVAPVEFDTCERRGLVYGKIDGLAIFEGDICLGRAADIEVARAAKHLIPQGIARKGAQYRWPGGIVPYQIAPGFPNPGRIREAIEHWHENTRLRLVLRTAANARDPAFEDYLSFEDHGACWSHVGRQGRRQPVSIGPHCPVGSVIHEIGHATGLWHEQSRSDRDEFVTVLERNIRPQDLHNFDQRIEDGTDLHEYDYRSIMHYPAFAFSRNGQPTIVPKRGKLIGQREKLSEGDKRAVAEVYAELYAIAT